METLRPFSLAARQRDLDRAATARYPQLLDRKRQRQLASPHGLFRGSAPLFYEILAARPDLAAGPPGDGWIAGDMHLENAGAYRTDADRVTFGLNDFDDASIGPLRLDVIRFATSALLAGRAARATGAEAIALAEGVIAAYGRADADAAAPWPAPIADMLQKASSRSRRALLDDRAPADAKGRRRFVRGDRYFDLPEPIAAAVPALVAAYVAALGARAPSHASSWQVEDAAMRVAGTGSLGVTRVAALVRDRQGEARIIELKEARRPSTEALLGPAERSAAQHAERVVAGARALAGEPHRQLAAVAVGEHAFVARKLFPQEDKLRLDALPGVAKLDAVAQAIGRVLGAAHARGAAATGAARPGAWSREDAAEVLNRAIELAGLFEGIYLAYARG